MEQTREEVVEQGDEVAGGEEHEMKQEGEQWTAELREQLWQEKVHVEEKLRCIQDEHFYELLQERWLERQPGSKETPDSLREELAHYRNTLKVDTLNGVDVEKVEVKEEEDVKEEMMLMEEEAIKQEGDEEESLVTMEDMENVIDEGSREKW